jgi:lysylphosphatidylglycerol synthetase-like protein (DUF2156 family)
MSYKKEIKKLIIISLIILLITIAINFSTRLSYCGKSTDCLFNLSVILLKYNQFILLPSAMALLFLLFFLMIDCKFIYEAWRNFSVIFLPIVVLISFFMPTNCTGMFCMLTQQSASYSMTLLFLLTSLFIIIIKSIQLRGKPEEETTKKK